MKIAKVLSACAALILPLFTHTPLSAQAQDDMNPIAKAYAQKHQALLPVVSVANVYVGCQQAKPNEFTQYTHKKLLNEMTQEQLGSLTLTCLDGLALKSETAIGYGIVGCFSSQFKHLANAEQNEKMAQVKALLDSLSLEQKKQSLTQCVNDQTLQLL